MAQQTSLFSNSDYLQLLSSLKQQIQQAQLRAALAVNHELVLLYWHIGHEIVQRQEEAGWGAKVINHLSQDLKLAFPNMKGFSPRNLKYMRAFALAYPDIQIVHQAGAQIPWKHNWVESREAIKPRPSQLDLYVRLSPHTAPDILSFSLCSCGCNDGRIHVLRQD